MENLYKVQGTQAQMDKVWYCLVICYLSQHKCQGLNGLIQYLRKHQSLIINYQGS